MYLASATRPNISFAVSKLSNFSSNPESDHWRGIDQVMLYLIGTMIYAIHYSGYLGVLEGYSDSNWIQKLMSLRPLVDTYSLLGGGAVSWRSCKQTILTKSIKEAELTALDTASTEAKWLRDMLIDLPLVEKPVLAILINCDN